MNLEKYVTQNEINISKEDWEKIKENDKDEVREELASIIIKYSLPFPYPIVKHYKIYESFYDLERKKGMFLESTNIQYKFDYRYKLGNRYVEGLNSGIDSLKFYVDNHRIGTSVDGYTTAVQDWGNKNKLKRMLSPLWSFDIKEINSKTLFRAISLSKQIPSHFKPEIAKTIYEEFNAKSILDIAHGWGGRLLGFITAKTTEKYIGLDTNTIVQDSLYNLLEDLEVIKDIELINVSSEDFIRPNTFDFIFSSLPYFNKERYLGEDQSCNKYSNLNSWMINYLYPSINNAWDSLKSNGFLVLNISDIKVRTTHYKICDKMNDFISDLPGAEEGTHFGIRLGIRPNTLISKDKIFCEPVWVWKKK
jgi:hypothetical protein